MGLIYCTTISASGLESGFFIIAHITALFHSRSGSGHSHPQSFAMQRQPYPCLHVVSLPVSPFCVTLCVWIRSPKSTRPHPRGTAVVMVTMPITVTEREAVSRGRAGGCHRHRWLFHGSASHSLPSSHFC